MQDHIAATDGTKDARQGLGGLKILRWHEWSTWQHEHDAEVQERADGVAVDCALGRGGDG